MTVRGGLLVLLCVGLVCLAGFGSTPTRAQETEPETEETTQASETVDDQTEETAEETPAEEQSEQREYTEDVTVTAIRVESDLMETPIAVTVLDQDTMNREGIQNVRDLAAFVPNMDIATINGQSTPIIALRGVRSTNETELGDPAVGVHLDGVYTPRMQGALALMFDNERVEVLRGPQGTLFGRNSTVGNINIVTAKPKFDDFHASATLRVANYNFRETQVIANIPASKKLAFRVAARLFARDSYIDGYWDPNQYDTRRLPAFAKNTPVIAPGSFEECTSPKCYTRTQHSNWWAESADGGYEIRDLAKADEGNFYMDAEQWAYRISALWKPSKKVSLNLSWQRFRDDSSGGIDLVNCNKLRGRPVRDEDGNIIGKNDCADMFPEDDTYQAVVNTPGRFFLDIDYFRTELDWDIKRNLRFVFLGGLEDMDRESAQDMELSLNAWDQAMFFLPGTGSNSWSSEVQLQSYGNKHFNWIAGVNYFEERTKTLGYFDNAIGEKSFWDQPNRSTNAGAVFAQGTYSFNPKWHLTFGYRYSDETKQDRDGQTFTCTPQNGCAPPYLHREELNDLPVDYFDDPNNYRNQQGELVTSANDNKGSWSHNDFRLGLDYQVNENTLLYSYLASGFKSGGIGDVFHEINPRDGEEINVRTSFRPEEVLTLEFGFKLKLAKRKLDLRGAYFYSDYEDMQYASVGAIAFTERWQALRDENGELIYDEFGNIQFGWVANPIVAYFTQNVPGARIQGFELEYDSRPWTGGRIFGYFSWLDTEITDDWNTAWNYDPVSYFGLNFEQAIDPSNEALQVNLKGNELAVSAPFKFHVTVDHAFLFARANTTVVPWITAHWEDASYLTIWNVDKHTDDLDFVIEDEDIKYTDDRRAAWSMVHAGVRVYHGKWMFEAFGYNLTNEVIQYWGGAAEQVAKGSFSMPTNYGVQIGYRF